MKQDRDFVDFLHDSDDRPGCGFDMRRVAYTLRQWQLWKLFEEPPTGLSPERIERKLAIRDQYVVIYYKLAYMLMPLVSFTWELLQLEPQARAKALVKVCELEQSLLSPLENIRPP